MPWIGNGLKASDPGEAFHADDVRGADQFMRPGEFREDADDGVRAVSDAPPLIGISFQRIPKPLNHLPQTTVECFRSVSASLDRDQCAGAGDRPRGARRPVAVMAAVVMGVAVRRSRHDPLTSEIATIGRYRQNRRNRVKNSPKLPANMRDVDPSSASSNPSSTGGSRG